MDALKKRGMLYRKETIEHTYPFCWRCETPLIYYARSSWYIRVTDYKKQLSETNKSINWHPQEIRDGRFGNWLEDLKDWGISRERFWGTPLPLWICDACETTRCVGSFEELKSAKHTSGASVSDAMQSGTFDPHKPYVDEVTLDCNCAVRCVAFQMSSMSGSTRVRCRSRSSIIPLRTRSSSRLHIRLIYLGRYRPDARLVLHAARDQRIPVRQATL